MNLGVKAVFGSKGGECAAHPVDWPVSRLWAQPRISWLSSAVAERRGASAQAQGVQEAQGAGSQGAPSARHFATDHLLVRRTVLALATPVFYCSGCLPTIRRRRFTCSTARLYCLVCLQGLVTGDTYKEDVYPANHVPELLGHASACALEAKMAIWRVWGCLCPCYIVLTWSQLWQIPLLRLLASNYPFAPVLSVSFG